MIQLTAEVYKMAANEHIPAASKMYDLGHYVLANYVAEVAVESIFRAYRFRIDPVFDSRHDLRDLYRRSKARSECAEGRLLEGIDAPNSECVFRDCPIGSTEMASVTSLKKQLRRALDAHFPGAEISIVNPTAVGKMGGTVVWKGFVGKDQVERHRAIREALSESLTPEERAMLSAIFAMTPDEVAVMNEA